MSRFIPLSSTNSNLAIGTPTLERLRPCTHELRVFRIEVSNRPANMPILVIRFFVAYSRKI